jgi:hypothetical protein
MAAAVVQAMAAALVSPAAVAADVEVVEVVAAAGGVRTSTSSKTLFR